VPGVVWPAGIVKLEGATVSFDVSLLTTVTVTPPAGAALERVTASGTL
jgi:hypothetical protein